MADGGRAPADLSYYRATASHEGFAALRGAVQADVCIIGGGFAGLATAASLMEKGQRDVVVL